MWSLERARIGRSGVGLGRVVSDLLEREGRELRGEFAQSAGVLHQRAKGVGLGGIQGAGDCLVVDLAGPDQVGPVELRRVAVAVAASVAAAGPSLDQAAG